MPSCLFPSQVSWDLAQGNLVIIGHLLYARGL